MYHMLSDDQQELIQKIERRALNHFIEDLLSICDEQEQDSLQFKVIEQKIN